MNKREIFKRSLPIVYNYASPVALRISDNGDKFKHRIFRNSIIGCHHRLLYGNSDLKCKNNRDRATDYLSMKSTKKRLPDKRQPLHNNILKPSDADELVQRFLRRPEFFRNVRKRSVFYVHGYLPVFVEEQC